MPTVNWRTLSGPQKHMQFLDYCSVNVLQQHVKEPTRMKSNTILDLIFSTIGTNISELNVEESLGSSDHNVLSFEVLIPSRFNFKGKSLINRRNYNKADWPRLLSIVAEVDWDVTFEKGLV